MNKGFTLILAVLISSIVLAIGLAMFNISIKQTLLSYTARESHFAFYAADAGLECVQYWEYVNDWFNTSKSGPTDTITCNGGSVTVTYSTSGSNYIRTFSLMLGAVPDSPCATVTVTKTNTPSTIMESRGYNVGDGPNCTSSNPKRTERAIRITQ
jgi:Tfp pilus assembly protein PilX